MPPFFPLAAVLALSALAASAQPVSQHFSFDGQHVVAETAVPFRDLDLGSQAGLRALRQRIETAADAVCDAPARAKGDQRQAFLICRDAAIRTAIAHTPQPVRTRLAALR